MWCRNCLPFRRTRVHSRISVGFVLLHLWFSIQCFVDRCLSCFDPLVCLLSKTFQSVGLQIFWPWVHMKTVIPETRLVHYIWYLRLIFRFDIYVWYLRLISTFYTRKTKRWIDWIPLYHAEEIYVDCLKMQYSYTTPSSCEGNVF
jgi:hypothetical protein